MAIKEMMGFTVGDKIRRTECSHAYGMQMGETDIIKYIDHDGTARLKGRKGWYSLGFMKHASAIWEDKNA